MHWAVSRRNGKRSVLSWLRSAIGLALISALHINMSAATSHAQADKTQIASQPQSVIIDTDIGGDIDDVYAVGLALKSPELNVLGIMTEFEDTLLEARLTSRFLKETGRPEIPVAVGTPKRVPPSSPLNEARYAERGPVGEKYPNAVEFLLQQIRQHPGEITLVAIGPETNIGLAIDRDMATFRKLKRVVIMGGSIYHGYNIDNTYQINNSPSAEYNIAMDVPAAQKLFRSGVPLYVMPVDATQIKLEELRRSEIFSAGTPMTDAITLLTEEWAHGLSRTPTLNDPMAMAYAIDSSLCPTTPMNLSIDLAGFTRIGHESPNAYVCLHSDQDHFFTFFMPRILASAQPQVSH